MIHLCVQRYKGLFIYVRKTIGEPKDKGHSHTRTASIFNVEYRW